MREKTSAVGQIGCALRYVTNVRRQYLGSDPASTYSLRRGVEHMQRIFDPLCGNR